MKHKLTAKHLAIFEKECNVWIKKFGLFEWEMYYVLKPLGDSMAACSADADGRAACLLLADEWVDQKPTVVELKEAAKHEVLELLLWDLTQLVHNRFITESSINEVRHAVIRRLENVL